MSAKRLTRKAGEQAIAMLDRERTAWAARGHCTTWNNHSLLCDRDGQFCLLPLTHDGPCQPHGKARP
jgi:hypothetical protein